MFKNLIKFISRRVHSQEVEIKYCRRCGRKLKSEESKKLGLGRCCYNKEVRTKYTKPLF